jgi:hypothetical protein
MSTLDDQINDLLRLLARLVDAAERIADAAELASEENENEDEGE